MPITGAMCPLSVAAEERELCDLRAKLLVRGRLAQTTATGYAYDWALFGKWCSVALIGLDPRDRYSAHSLRAGFVTAAAEGGAGELLIAEQTGHRSMDVLRGYFRRTNLFRANACSLIGL